METHDPGYIFNHRFTAHSSRTENGREGFTLWETRPLRGITLADTVSRKVLL